MNNSDQWIIDIFNTDTKREKEPKPTDGVRSTNFYQTPRWLKVRDEIKIRDKMTCRSCGRPIIGRYVVDHIKPVTLENMYDWDISLNPENLQLLCLECHNEKTFRKTTKAESLW